MNEKHSDNSLDETIDTLLQSRPVRPRDGFADDVLAALEQETEKKRRSRRKRLALLAPLPFAAAFALLFGLSGGDEPTAPPEPEVAEARLTEAEIRQILLLEDGLSALASAEPEGFATETLSTTLDAITIEI